MTNNIPEPMQWFLITEHRIIHQYDNDTDQKGKRISVVYDIQNDPAEKLLVMGLISYGKFVSDLKMLSTLPIRLLVDFTTGLFHINGISFDRRPQDVKDYEIRNGDLRFIYYKTTRRSFDLSTGKDLGGGIQFYKLGWQITILGKNYQRLMLYDITSGMMEFKEKR